MQSNIDSDLCNEDNKTWHSFVPSPRYGAVSRAGSAVRHVEGGAKAKRGFFRRELLLGVIPLASTMSSRVFDPHEQRFAPRSRRHERHFIVPVCSIFFAVLAACSPSNPDGDTQNSQSDEDSDEDTTESEKKEFECQIPDGEDTDFVQVVGCEDDFEALASAPLDVSIPGARSLKTVVDRIGDNEVYFQNSNKYKIHWEFVSEHLSGNGLPIVPTLAEFNTTEYYSPDRRFVLGALTRRTGSLGLGTFAL